MYYEFPKKHFTCVLVKLPLIKGLGELISWSSQKKCFDLLSNFLNYRKSSIKPPPPPGGAYLFQAHLREGLFSLEKTMVEYKVEKLKYKKVGGHAAEDQNQIQTSNW